MSELNRVSSGPAAHPARRLGRATARRKGGLAVAAAVLAVACATVTGVGAADAHDERIGDKEVRVALPAGQSNPAIATGVGLGGEVAVYQSSGLGPGALNPGAPAGSPEMFTDPATTAGAQGVTVTEAQSLVVLKAIQDNLKAAGLTPADVVTMKCYLVRPPGAAAADYAGWNRAYRQFFANTDLTTKQPVPVPMGTSPAKAPLLTNPARPARATTEVVSLAVPGWLVEVEVTAVYPKSRR
ncbi:Rid family hydrolase [Yinghuangia seranimata]|uniref:Rid family hydrolase n=1 Tax=Yinghuangia seranimata TaxID=408067 RepID=UPI00248C741E|nr:Rid family hydrolase [Yinghuangia seranimata]MDI2127294.1 Rid family hydrolase [Yinghuangia seranimata]